jgi:hypothetical protein
MPRYYFDLANGHRLADPSGLDCRDNEEAKAKAEVIARQVAADAPNSGGRRLTIVNEDGEEITTVPIGER